MPYPGEHVSFKTPGLSSPYGVPSAPSSVDGDNDKISNIGEGFI
jgi:hypothetical protein